MLSLVKFSWKLFMISIYIQEYHNSVCTSDKPKFKDVLQNIWPVTLKKFQDHEKQWKTEKLSQIQGHQRDRRKKSKVVFYIQYNSIKVMDSTMVEK